MSSPSTVSTFQPPASLTSLTTPYGTTTFTITSSGSQSGRAVEITEPNNGKHLFVSKDQAAGVPSTATERAGLVEAVAMTTASLKWCRGAAATRCPHPAGRTVPLRG